MISRKKLESKYEQAWRVGVYTTAKKHLVNKEWLDFLSAWFNVLRVIPTALLFTSVTEWLFQTLGANGELVCKEALRKNYFVPMDAEVARTKFQIESWAGDAGFIWTADWWAGVERLQPGSTGGSQAQESWHRHKLQSIVKNLHLSVDVFANRLERVTKLRYAQFRFPSTQLPDVPQEPYPDTYLLNGAHLPSRGRSGAYQFHDALAYRSYLDDDGIQYYGMPSSSRYER